MSMFQGILPSDNAPGPVQTPEGILALLHGTPVTANLAAGLSAPPPPMAPPTGGALAAAAPAPGPGPRPILPTTVPAPSGPLPLPSPIGTGLAAASEGAAHAPVFNSPVATLASSVLEGIRKGAPAFAAQRQANKEANYVASLQAAEEKSLRDYIGSSEARDAFGPGGVAKLKALPSADVRKILTDNNLWKPEEFTQNSEGQIISTRTGKIVHDAPLKPVAKDAAVPVVGADGKPVLGVDGQPKYTVPNPSPVPTAYDKTDPEFKAYALQVDSNANDLNWKPSKDQATLINALIQKNKNANAAAGRAPLSEVITAEAAKAGLTTITKDFDSVVGQVRTLPALQRAKLLLDNDQVNTGLTSGIAQQWSKLKGDDKAAATEEYIANVLTTLIPEVRGQLAGGGGIRFTQQEIALFQKAAGGDVSNQKAALQHILESRVNDVTAQAAEHNRHVGAFIGANPAASSQMTQYVVPVPGRGPQKHADSPTGYAEQGPDGKWRVVAKPDGAP